MGRIGVRTENAKNLIQASTKFKHIDVKGIFSHFACADEEDLSFTNEQFEQFNPLVEYAKKEINQQV